MDHRLQAVLGEPGVPGGPGGPGGVQGDAWWDPAAARPDVSPFKERGKFESWGPRSARCSQM